MRCLFKVDPHGPIDASREPTVFLADEETVSSVPVVASGRRERIGWASPPGNDYERKLLAEHPDCVWVTTNMSPVFTPKEWK